MKNNEQIIRELLVKYPGLLRTMINKDILIDDIIEYFVEIINEFKNVTDYKFEWALIGWQCYLNVLLRLKDY